MPSPRPRQSGKKRKPKADIPLTAWAKYAAKLNSDPEAAGRLPRQPRAAKAKRRLYEIKPLVWKSLSFCTEISKTVLGDIRVWRITEDHDEWWPSCGRYVKGTSLEVAKQRAECQYQQQLRRALREVS